MAQASATVGLEDRDRLGNTKLINAVLDGSAAEVSRLIQLGANVNAMNLEGDTALIAAAKIGNYSILTFLLSVNADANAMNSNNDTALNIASARGQPGLVKALLAQTGINPSIANISDGFTPLHSAIYAHYYEGRSLDMVIDLIHASSDIEARTKDKGYTPLMLAASLGLSQAVMRLLEAGAGLYATSPQGETALDIARRENHTLVASILSDDHWANSAPSRSDLLRKGAEGKVRMKGQMDAINEAISDIEGMFVQQ